MLINAIFNIYEIYVKIYNIYNDILNNIKNIYYKKYINKSNLLKNENIIEDIKVYYKCEICNKNIVDTVYCYMDKCYCSEDCRNINICK